MINRFMGEYRWLSNFHICPITIRGTVFSSTEAAYQASKLSEGSLCEFEAFSTMTPGQAKRAGMTVPLRPDWESVKSGIMLDLQRQKFCDEELREKLLSTGDEVLVEGNTWCDNYWGDCTCDKCVDIIGQNMLGKAIMKVRKEISESLTSNNSDKE